MRKVIYYILLVIITLPLLQTYLGVFDEVKLNGVSNPTENIGISSNNWFSGTFQNKKEKYINENIGFRNHLVLTNNQFAYTLYKVSMNPKIIIGEDQYLHHQEYIDNYTGKNYIGDKKHNIIVLKLKLLQDLLERKNITLLTAILPSKASFFPESIPKRYKSFPKNNYNEYISAFDSLNVNYIDINRYFQNIKKTCKYPLFPKNGLHWTSYGMALGMDTLIKSIETYRHTNLPQLEWDKKIVLDPLNRLPDYDAENVLNLWFDIEREPMPYPNFIFNKQRSSTKTMVISDSYYWQVYSALIPHNIFDWGGFWYYFKTLRHKEDGSEKNISTDSLNIKETLLKQDIIVLFASHATLNRYPYGFETKAYNELVFRDYNATIQHFKQKILNDEKWQVSIWEKAKNNGLTFDQQLSSDVSYTSKKYLKDNYPEEYKKFIIIENIKNSPNWLKKIKEKAEKENIPLEDMILMDAEWLYKKNSIK